MRSINWLLLCVVLVNIDIIAGRGRGTSSRGSSRHSSPSHGVTGGRSTGGWFNWLRSSKTGGTSNTGNNINSKPASTRPFAPSFNHKSTGFPSGSYQHGFNTQGHHYATNYYSGYHPIPHPYQSHFQPLTTCLFTFVIFVYFLSSIEF